MAYGENSIGALIGAQRVRQRPAAVLGSANLDGALHCVIEMYGNIMDEKTSGYGDKMDVKLYNDGSISMRDYGRGVPLGWNESKETYNWHLVYNEMYGGGKYDDNQEALRNVTDWEHFDEKDINYLFSVGLNGLGCAATQYCSEFFHVVSVREEEGTGKRYKYEMHFKEGLPIIGGRQVDVFAEKYDFTTYEQEVVETDEPTGTYVHWKPDAKVFTDVNIPAQWVVDLCRNASYMAGMDVHCEIEPTGGVYDFKGGTLAELLPNLYPSKLYETEKGVFTLDLDTFEHGEATFGGDNLIWVLKANIVMAVATDDNRLDSVCFHNMVRMNQGMQYAACQDAVDSFLAGLAKQRGYKLAREDYSGLFVFAVSSFSNIASFRGQTKDGVDDLFIYEALRKKIESSLDIEYRKGTKGVVDAVETVMSRADMRMQLKEAEKQITAVNKVKRQKDPDKFLSCEEYMDKNYARTELWITEGDSAKDSVAAARDGRFQAVLPIKGKGLNILKSSIPKLLANKEIMGIISLLGTGIDLNIKGMKLFNEDDLRFDKIIIATDADVDGYQIRVLLFVLFYRLTPKLLTSGRVYIAETPRFALVLRDGTYVYAKDDADVERKMKEYAGRWTNIKRYKGLGEVDKEVLRETTVGVARRNLIPVTVDYSNELEADLIDALFGEDKHKQRKDILTMVLGENVGEEMLENLARLSEIDESEIEEDTEYEDWG